MNEKKHIKELGEASRELYERIEEIEKNLAIHICEVNEYGTDWIYNENVPLKRAIELILSHLKLEIRYTPSKPPELYLGKERKKT